MSSCSTALKWSATTGLDSTEFPSLVCSTESPWSQSWNGNPLPQPGSLQVLGERGANLVSLIPFRQTLAERVWCDICDQLVWRVRSWVTYYDCTITFVAWCHGARREFKVDDYIWELTTRRPIDLVAFPAPLLALVARLFRIRRLRGRRLPLADRSRMTVWLAPPTPSDPTPTTPVKED